jgi:CHAT domain-containing protein
MYAGTPTITVTLWDVESSSAKQHNVAFFEYISKNESKDVSLQKAKLDMVNGKYGELYKQPFYWAPVVLFGDN